MTVEWTVVHLKAPDGFQKEEKDVCPSSSLCGFFTGYTGSEFPVLVCGSCFMCGLDDFFWFVGVTAAS